MRPGRSLVLALIAMSLLVSPSAPQAQTQAPSDSTPSTPPTPPTPSRPPAPSKPPSPTAPTAPGQPPTQQPEAEREPPPTAERPADVPRVPEEAVRGGLFGRGGRLFSGPDLLNPPAHQGWITLTPSFTLSGEYNDNLFLTSRNRESDGTIGLTPGLTLTMQKPNYRLSAGYNTSGQLYIDNSDLNGFGNEQRFFVDGFYQISPRVVFSLSDQFVYSEQSNVLTTGAVAVGRTESWRNTVTPRLDFQLTPSTGLNAYASHTILRFGTEVAGERDSDTYRLGFGLGHRLTQRLGAALGFSVAYVDISDEPSAWTYTPTVGFSYDITPTLRGSVSGGPSIVQRSGDTTVTPAITAELAQTFQWGYLRAGYDRAVTAETIGLSDRQAFYASLGVVTLLRGLQLELVPRYTIVDTDVASNRGIDETVKTVTVTLQATYQIARNISAIASYTFFNQTVDTRGVGDIDQNRAFLGVQYAFPITIY